MSNIFLYFIIFDNKNKTYSCHTSFWLPELWLNWLASLREHRFVHDIDDKHSLTHIQKNLFQKISLFIYAQVWPWQWSWIVCIANVHFASNFRTDMQGVDIFSLGSMLNMLPCQDGWQTGHLKPLCTTLCILQLLNGEGQPALADQMGSDLISTSHCNSNYQGPHNMWRPNTFLDGFLM